MYILYVRLRHSTHCLLDLSPPTFSYLYYYSCMVYSTGSIKYLRCVISERLPFFFEFDLALITNVHFFIAISTVLKGERLHSTMDAWMLSHNIWQCRPSSQSVTLFYNTNLLHRYSRLLGFPVDPATLTLSTAHTNVLCHALILQQLLYI